MMLDLSCKVDSGEIFNAHIEKSFDSEAAPDKLSKNLQTPSLLMVPIVAFVICKESAIAYKETVP